MDESQLNTIFNFKSFLVYKITHTPRVQESSWQTGIHTDEHHHHHNQALVSRADLSIISATVNANYKVINCSTAQASGSQLYNEASMSMSMLLSWLYLSPDKLVTIYALFVLRGCLGEKSRERMEGREDPSLVWRTNLWCCLQDEAGRIQGLAGTIALPCWFCCLSQCLSMFGHLSMTIKQKLKY